ncbi:MAG: acyl carrier protein [Cyanobacteria bacterium SW_11_48_12]|jgi:acyl carrier protein|nr:MAG: acyl carrier protein [Cyanobacteria bacterium SW_11_48_12]
MANSIEDKIRETMAELLEVDEEIITDDFNPDHTDTWDSLNNLKMITALEEEFNISLTMKEINSMVNFASIKNVVSSKHVTS